MTDTPTVSDDPTATNDDHEKRLTQIEKWGKELRKSVALLAGIGLVAGAIFAEVAHQQLSAQSVTLLVVAAGGLLSFATGRDILSGYRS